MNPASICRTLVSVGLLAVANLRPIPALAAGVVGTGTAASCTEAALDAALTGGGTVTFTCGSGPVTITVTSTKTMSADTTIDGGSLITISGGHSVGVFSVNTGVAFTVQNLTIANGSIIKPCGFGIDGGGIDNERGTLTVINSTFSGNSAAGGGAIYSSGTLTVTDSTFSGNSAHVVGGLGTCGGTGGGIANSSGTVTVTNSTFSGNSADEFSGGGIANVSGGTLTVINSTFSGNSAIGGGGILNYGTLMVTNSTFSANSATGGGSAIANSGGSATVTNSVFSNITSAGNCNGPITDGGHNLDDGTSCGFSTTNGSLSNTDPKLDPEGLKDNGGPTPTIALLPASPAINAGDPNVCATAPVNGVDQRGYVRPGTGYANCSIGAFEYNSPGPPPSCAGDCNHDGEVTVTELVTLVNIALGTANISACMAGDANHDGLITISEIITAVNRALNGCDGS